MIEINWDSFIFYLYGIFWNHVHVFLKEEIDSTPEKIITIFKKYFFLKITVLIKIENWKCKSVDKKCNSVWI